MRHTSARTGDQAVPGGKRRASGFTILEMLVVLIIGMVLIGLAAIAFEKTSTNTSARSAAQVFTRDLAMARSHAVRERQKVTINFYESSKWYLITTASGRELARRRFGVGGNNDVNLSAVNLQTTGDSVVFSTRGIATLSGALGTATFTAGNATYTVSFNSLGASSVGGP